MKKVDLLRRYMEVTGADTAKICRLVGLEAQKVRYALRARDGDFDLYTSRRLRATLKNIYRELGELLRQDEDAR